MIRLIGVVLVCFDCITAWPKEVKLLLQEGRARDVKIKEVGSGVYEITTEGGDPCLFFKPETTRYDPKELTVLAFDYFCLEGLDSFQVFWGPPISVRQAVDGTAPIPTEGWLPYAVDMSSSAASNFWTRPFKLFRLDFGKKPGKTIQIRNVRLRGPTEKELRMRLEREKEQKRIAGNVSRLKKYLAGKFPSRVESVTAAKENIMISYRCAGENLLLFESPAWTAVYENPAPVYALKLKSGKGSIKVPRFDKDGRDRIYSRWFIGGKTTGGIQRQSHEVYVSDLTALPPKAYTDKPFGGIKGIGGIPDNPKLYPDLVELGVHHIRLPAVMSAFLSLKPGKNREPFVSQGRTYYVNLNQLRRFDRLLLFADRHDMHVAVVLLLRPNLSDPEEQRIFNHPDTVSPGKYSMANVTTREGFEAYCAFIELLASRYCRPDRKYGRITHWIVHNEVDSGWIWTNIGRKPSLLYMHDYVRALRATQTAVRQYSPSGKAFISLTHCWNEPHIDNGLFYSGREVMKHLLEFCRAEGDFEWGIALHPYPRSLRDPCTTWQPAKSKFSFDTPLITFYNIEVIDAFARRPDVRYQGKKVRSVILSEQGFNTPDYSEESFRNQAAALAYGWKKIKNIPSIEAFHYHRWIDHEKEGGLKLGLWTVKPGTVNMPEKKKPAYKVFQALETPREDEACRFALDIIGIRDFSGLSYRGEIK